MDTPPPASTPSTSDPGATDRALRGLLVVVFAVIVIRTAWICDDAFITLRTVDNFVHGRGLVWNTFERVQAYTHPLWMLLVSAFYFVTREPYFTTLFVSGACSIAAVSIFSARLSATPRQGILAVLILLLSRSFVDYSTGGLENPLLDLLLTLFLVVYCGEGRQRPLRLASIAALVLLTRMDAILLIGPALYVALRAAPWRSSLRALALGMIPFVAWELFSVVYYGFLLPNTAYAKLAHQIPAADLVAQGFAYCLRQWSHDPLSFTVIGVAIVAPLLLRARALWPLSLGLVLYLLYLLKIGGDFMVGRFFAAPLLVAVAILARLDLRPPTYGLVGAGGLVLLLGLGVAQPTITSDEDYGEDREGLLDRGVADERAFYYPETGLLRFQRGREVPPATANSVELPRHPELVYPMKSVGMLGYRIGPEVRLVDTYGLCDPLLARLPARGDEAWRIGHFARHIPAGYLQSIEDGDDRLIDRDLAEYYRQLRLVTSGPLFSGERWAAIVRLNTGQLDRLIDVDYYRAPIYPRLTDVALRRPKNDGKSWGQFDVFPIPAEGLLVTFAAVEHRRALDVSLEQNDLYRFDLERDGATIWSKDVKAKRLRTGGLRRSLVPIPEAIAARGYDAIRIHILESDGHARIGHLIPVDSGARATERPAPAIDVDEPAPERSDESSPGADGDEPTGPP